MAIITQKSAVSAVYADAARRGWVLPAFGTENSTTTEAILAGTAMHAATLGEPELPVILAITNLYDERQQSVNYTHTGRWDVGMKRFLTDVQILAGEPDSPFANLRVMIHLDHIRPEVDAELLAWDMGAFSSILFDASAFAPEENIRLTRAFVKAQGENVLIEGAFEGIVSAGKSATPSPSAKPSLDSIADAAQAYVQETDVDLVVADLGTEHRAGAAQLFYRQDTARAIAERIGARLVLHGTSSVPEESLGGLFADGISKVNLWTALERDSSVLLFADMVRNAARVVGAKEATRLFEQGLLGAAADRVSRPDLAFFTTAYRQSHVFEAMRDLVTRYLVRWYTPRKDA